MDLFKNIVEVKGLLDKIYLQTLELIEEDVSIKINIEKLTNEGTLNLAKTRYNQGSNTVSITQLPTDDDREFFALKTVERTSDINSNCTQFALECHAVDKDSNHIDPINWFGVLIPQSLKIAREKYEKAIELSIESANVRQKIAKNCELIRKLKRIKRQFEKIEE
ncbi:hypothetical protein PVAND_010560 [Polypedilum vanderplanki]|uniref:Vacuolar ATPase assembly protein VMA22 n=1 Tax=Polypedilum vanderplanki TaxID=319348 RepID=A0A9J6CHM6_POLVA|nr:hypothetical protein PVAND_010560 [Polypedilum vanderplanki]